MKDTRSPQTKRFHEMIDGWLKEKPRKVAIANNEGNKRRRKSAKRKAI